MYASVRVCMCVNMSVCMFMRVCEGEWECESIMGVNMCIGV